MLGGAEGIKSKGAPRAEKSWPRGRHGARTLFGVRIWNASLIRELRLIQYPLIQLMHVSAPVALESPQTARNFFAQSGCVNRQRKSATLRINIQPRTSYF